MKCIIAVRRTKSLQIRADTPLELLLEHLCSDSEPGVVLERSDSDLDLVLERSVLTAF